MSMLILATQTASARAGQSLALAQASAAAQGFGGPQRFDWAGGAAWLYPTPAQATGSGCAVRLGQRFAVSVGAFHWRGLGSTAALTRLLQRDDAVQAWPWDQISGAYCMLLGRDDGVWLVGDALGLMKVYEVEGGGLISTSMLACCAALDRVTVASSLQAQQYVLLGASHGLQTAIAGIRLVDPTVARNLMSGQAVKLHAPQRLLGRAGLGAPASPAEAVAAVSAEITAEFTQLRQAHGPNIGMALSGGFDSRLLLAALDGIGVRPDLFVYGRPQDDDVAVAVGLAERLGLPMDALDKARAGRDLAPLNPAKIESNLHFFDGLPVDGVFDRGCDQASRLKQVQAGRLNLNGGGGEILRNFFYLPGGSYTAVDLFSVFYAGWLDAVFLAPEQRQAFIASVQDEILAVLGREGGSPQARRQPLLRAEVELVYTLFRLRYWMGCNNSLFARQGAFMTPLVTPGLVALAAAVPLAWKEYGRLEAAVITQLSPRVAAGPSSYGFDFSAGPPWQHRRKTDLTRWRPVGLRRHSYRLQKALGRLPSPQASAEWCEALGAGPCADWLNPAALTSLDQVNRLMTLQALLALQRR